MSAKGKFQHFYVYPHCFWWGKNDRILLGQTLASIDVQDRAGNIQKLINAGSHNYCGVYKMTAESEELQRLCLEKLTFADVKGVPSLHAAMNEAVCRHFSVDFCCSSSSGYGSNLLALSAILDQTWLIVMDEKCHSSMFTGAYLAETGRVTKFRHNDMIQLSSILKELGPKYKNILIGIEGFYSMDGTVPALANLHQLKKEYGFALYCDEAHSFLSIGSGGRGCLELWNDEHPSTPLPNDLIDIRAASLSKVVGGLGGVVFGSARFEPSVRRRFEKLHERGEESVSTSTIVQTLYVLGRPALLRQHLHHLRSISMFCRQELQRFGVYVHGNAVTPILPIHAGRASMAAKLSFRLRQLGLLATPVSFPAVEFWESRVRVTISADFSDDQVNELVDYIIEASQNLGIAKKVKMQRRWYSYAGNNVDTEDEEFEEHVQCFRNIHGLIEHDATNQENYNNFSKQAFERNCGPPVLQAGHKSRAKYGLGSSGSRWLTGTFTPHLEVEQIIAEITQQEAAMTFANAEIGLSSTIAALCRPLLGYKKHYMLVPVSAHDSVREGLRFVSKKEKPEAVDYKNSEDLFAILSRSANRTSYFTIYVDTVIDGKLVDIKKIVPQLHKYKGQSGMTLLLNDSNGLGHHGPDGLGIAGSMDLWSTARALDAQILLYGSFYRAFGLSGGFLAGDDVLIQELRFTSRGYMFATSPQPFVMDMVKKALENKTQEVKR